DLLERATELRARVEAVDADFVARYGWDRPRATLEQDGGPGHHGGREGLAGFAARPRQPDAVTVDGRHDGKQAGLTTLEGSRNGTGIKGAEYGASTWLT